MDNKPGPSDAPKPPTPPPPPADNSAARKTASTVGSHEMRKPAPGLAFEGQRDSVAGQRLSALNRIDAARTKATDAARQVATTAREKVPDLIKKGAAVAGATGLVVAGNFINSAKIEANMAKLSPHREQPALVEKAGPAAKVAEVNAPKPPTQQEVKRQEAAEKEREQIEQKGEAAENIQTGLDTVAEEIQKRREGE